MRIDRDKFGTLPDGRVIDLITLRNRAGITLRVITFGGIIVSLSTPDRAGDFDDIVLGFDTLAGYLGESPYFGAIIGRVGNRIANGRFVLDAVEYHLATNNGPNHLHGGIRGFDKVVWEARTFERDDAAGVVLTYTSPDGEEGYPGRLDAAVTYTLNDRGELVVDYSATTDAPTVVNLTQHSYFNLGHAGSDVLAHELTIDADAIVAVDATLIPTGALMPVQGTPFDFRVATPIGARIDADHPQLQLAGGYDHTYVLGAQTRTPRRAAFVRAPSSGRTLEVETTEPGVQLYTGNFLDGSIRGEGGVAYPHRGGFCLETQHFPDAPNQPAFPSIVLRPGDRYESRTIFRFDATSD
ncbi:MAG TPA: aldose epimerase family protein [Gemmatimonadaceae bacterium]|nr:aldose epimerase family protein [Gemmatimonadaceae bacterium]